MWSAPTPPTLLAGTASARMDDEFALMGGLRDEATPIVRCRTASPSSD